MWVKFTTIEKTKVILILYSTHINYCFMHSTQQKNTNTDSVHYLLYCIAQSSTKKEGKKEERSKLEKWQWNRFSHLSCSSSSCFCGARAIKLWVLSLADPLLSILLCLFLLSLVMHSETFWAMLYTKHIATL